MNRSPLHAVWLMYDDEADSLYVNFKKPSYATDSEMTDDDVIVRYEGEEVIGFTVLHASKRMKKSGNQVERNHGANAPYRFNLRLRQRTMRGDTAGLAILSQCAD